MATRMFRTPTVTPLTWWRVDTAAGSSTPAAISTADGSTPYYGTFRSDKNGVLSPAAFRGPDGVTTLYLKRMTREVAGSIVAGTTITLDTGAVIPDPSPPAAPGGGVSQGQVDASIASAVSGLGATFVPKWQAATAYASGDKVLNPSGQVVSANTGFTSGGSYSAANWTVVPPAQDLLADGVTYNGDGTVATSTLGGVTTTYTYNGDLTVNTEARLGKTKTYTYDGSGNVLSSAVV